MFDQFYGFLQNLGFKHPLHPMEVHLPIGLIIGALIFSLVAAVFKRERLSMTPRHCIILAFIGIFPTIFFGIMDWQHFYGGAWLLPIKVKLTVTPILACLLFAAIRLGRRYGATSGKVIFLYFLCFVCVVILGYSGGTLVYGNKTTTSPAEFKAGEKIYDSNCSACHPHGGNVIDPSKPVLHSEKLKDLNTFRGLIRKPGGNMPSFTPAEISDYQSKELYDYIVNVLEHPKKKSSDTSGMTGPPSEEGDGQ